MDQVINPLLKKKKDPWEQMMEALCKSTRGDN